MSPMKVLMVFGTRPEAIKLAPLYFALSEAREFDVRTCVTGQHRELLDQVLELFSIVPDHHLGIMKPNQTLYDITANGLLALAEVMSNEHPDLVIVQGDTTTALIGALAGFYEKCQVVHVEAGLRSGDRYSPFPEEMNRDLIGRLADWHFAPTEKARLNLEREGVTTNVFVVGNTGIDALFRAIDIVENSENETGARFGSIPENRELVLVTGHRRENFGVGMRNAFSALATAARKYAHRFEFVYPVHLNPNVREPANALLAELPNFHLIPPASYGELVWLMKRCRFVVTDSGGIQEEAPSLGKPVIVMRENTERMEGIYAGNAVLVGTDPDLIARAIDKFADDTPEFKRASSAANPYGDGTAASRIVEILAAASAPESFRSAPL